VYTNEAEILKRYGAANVVLTADVTEWLRSDHAGETGAVWIYKGAAFAFWSKKIQEMALEHGETERQHLVVMNHILQPSQRSKLIFLWKIMGFGLGFTASFFGYSIFCYTINVVETFVEKHYGEQIKLLEERRSNPDLLMVLKKCCEEEVEHKEDAFARIPEIKGNVFIQFWGFVVKFFSGIAVSIAKKI
tara:strand:- start:527 stop:1096 length:570 start_codon:yes stop_codon:yes gene_type:complete